MAVVGYSFGADVAPFMVASLPQNTQEKISSIVLINPSDVTDFEVELTDWLGLESADHGFAVLPEINKLKAYHIRCIYAAQEEDTACRDLNSLEVKVFELPGDHHLGAYVFRNGEEFYNFEGIRAYKEKFDPVWRPRYLACKGRWALPSVLSNLSSLIARGASGIILK